MKTPDGQDVDGNGRLIANPPSYEGRDMTNPKELSEQFEQFINAVEQLAFAMRAPNNYTPQFVQLCTQARAQYHETNKRLTSRPVDAEKALAIALGGVQVETNSFHGCPDTLAIALCTYFSDHMGRP